MRQNFELVFCSSFSWHFPIISGYIIFIWTFFAPFFLFASISFAQYTHTHSLVGATLLPLLSLLLRGVRWFIVYRLTWPGSSIVIFMNKLNSGKSNYFQCKYSIIKIIFIHIEIHVVNVWCHYCGFCCISFYFILCVGVFVCIFHAMHFVDIFSYLFEWSNAMTNGSEMQIECSKVHFLWGLSKNDGVFLCVCVQVKVKWGYRIALTKW